MSVLCPRVLLSIATSVSLLGPAPAVHAQWVRDSAGVRIVENAQPAGGGSGRFAVVDPVATVEIGAAEETPHLFTDIVHAFQASNGWIVVADAGGSGTSGEIRFFDGDGVHVQTFGGRGEGPGEFAFGPALRLLPSDTLLAWDPRLRRVTWFDLEGNVLRTASSNAQGLPLMLAPQMWALFPEGDVAVLDLPVGAPDRDGITVRHAHLVVAPLAEPRVRRISDLPAWTTVSAGGAWLLTSLHPQVSWAARTSDPPIVVSGSEQGEWELCLFDLTGSLRGIVRADVPRRPVTREMGRAERDWMLERVRRNRSLPPAVLAAMEGAIRGMSLPESAPAIGAVVTDSQDRVWVKRRSGRWEAEGTDVYDVIDRSGTWLGWVEVPRTHGAVLSVGQDHIPFRSDDAIGVPRLRRHALRLDRRGYPSN